jgi:hypothetical protein
MRQARTMEEQAQEHEQGILGSGREEEEGGSIYRGRF